MIINFKQFGNGGGSGPVDVPIATTASTGVVKIGEGINVDSAGTISVSGGDESFVLKSSSAMPQTASSGDVANINSHLMTLKASTGTSICIANMVDSYHNGIIKIEYYDLPTDGSFRLMMPNETAGQLIGPPITYSNGVFTWWDDTEMTIVLATLQFNGTMSIFEGAIQAQHIGDEHRGTIDIRTRDYIFKAYVVGDWANKPNPHYEPVDWDNVCLNINKFDYLPIASTNELGLVKIGEGINLSNDGTISVTGGTGGGVEVVTELPASGTDGQVVILVDSATSSTTEYIWSDNLALTADIDYTTNTGNTSLARWKYDELPNNCTLWVSKYNYSESYSHVVVENGVVKVYKSASADTITEATGYTIARYAWVNVGIYSVSNNLTDSTKCCWGDNEIIIITTGSNNRVSFNTNSFYRNGWRKNVTNKISDKVTYNQKTYSWYDNDMNLICTDPSLEFKQRSLKINPTGQYNPTATIYTAGGSGDIGPIFAPTTTGTTGYVCVAGNGWAAPTWVSPETITNGVKFWKGTQDEYEALSTHDSSTLYIIVEE